MGEPLWSILPKSRNNKLTNAVRQLHRFSTGAGLSPRQRYWNWASFKNENQAMALLHPNIKQKINRDVPREIQAACVQDIRSNDFNEVLLTDMNLVLLSDMLVKVDLMSMANSLEVRSPFLDQEVVAFAFGLPSGGSSICCLSQ